MSPALFLILALFAADVDEGPVTTAPEARPVRELPERVARPPRQEPASDYELVAWCYGALGGHMGLHDVAMPEVERIERQWAKSPEAADEDLKSYDVQYQEGVKALALFRDAMEAAEKASINPIQPKGVASIRKGESIWMGADMADPKRLAREWMSWGLPKRCMTTAETLEAEATVLGQALSYNAGEAEMTIEDEADLDAMESGDPTLFDDEDAMEAGDPTLFDDEDAMDAEAIADDAATEDEPEGEAPSSIDEVIEQQFG